FPVQRWSIWFGPPAKLDTLAIGMAMAVLGAAGLRWPNRWVRALVGGTGLAVVGVGISLRYNGFPDPFTHTVFGIGLTLLIGSTALSTERGPRWLEWRPLVLVAMTSYSL